MSQSPDLTRYDFIVTLPADMPQPVADLIKKAETDPDGFLERLARVRVPTVRVSDQTIDDNRKKMEARA